MGDVGPRLRLPGFYGWTIVASASGLLAVAYAPWFAFSALMPAIEATSPWSRSSITLAFTLYVITGSVAGPLAAWLLARLGPRRLQAAGGLVFALGLLGASTATALWHLYVFYGIVVGVGTSFMGITVNFSVVARWFSRRRGLALGITSAGAHAGAALFVPFTQAVISTTNWRVALVVMAGIALAVVPTLAWFQRAAPRTTGMWVDRDPQSASTETGAWAGEPQYPVMGDRRSFWMLFIGFGAAFAAFQLIVIHQVAILIGAGFSAAWAAGIASAVAGVTMIARFVIGVALDRIGRPVTYAGTGLAAMAGVGVLGLVILEGVPAWLVIGYVGMFGVGYAVAGPVAPAIAADLYDGETLGVAFSRLMIGAGLGGALGPLLGAYAYETTGSYALPLVVTCSLLAISIVAVLSIYRAWDWAGRAPDHSTQGRKP